MKGLIFLTTGLSEISNHPLLALTSPALNPSSSFCFELSYNNFTFSQIILDYMFAFLTAILLPHKSRIFQYKRTRHFMPSGIAAAMASWISFSFLIVVLTLDLFILKWWAIADADLNLPHISSNSTFSCSVMTYLCFMGTLPTSLSGTFMGPMVLFKVYRMH